MSEEEIPTRPKYPWDKKPAWEGMFRKAGDPPIPEAPQRMYCLPCIAEFKGAEQSNIQPESLPPIREAVTILDGAPHCYEHIAIQRQSPLQMPNGMNLG